MRQLKRVSFDIFQGLLDMAAIVNSLHEGNAFLERIFRHIPLEPLSIHDYLFIHWAVPEKPVDELMAFMPKPGIDQEKVMANVMNVSKYIGNVDHVKATRVIKDPERAALGQVRFHEIRKMPVIGDVQQEAVMERLKPRGGFNLIVRQALEFETQTLSPKQAVRVVYADEVWLFAPGIIGYGCSLAPKREDMDLGRWKAFTTMADSAWPSMTRQHLEAIARWDY